MRPFTQLLQAAAAQTIVALARLVTAPQAIWLAGPPAGRSRIYFANHASHGDFVLVWAVLPPLERSRTRPVAAADYWQRGWLRRAIGTGIFRAVLIAREHITKSNDPIDVMTAVLDEGSSLIVFPEGTRNVGGERLQPFKSGLYHLAKARPQVELVPVWIDNLNRVMPKGEFLPVPLLCTVRFGAPLTIIEDERKAEFLERARIALLETAPQGARS
jgi:1-acyl-sn-glycerol-3-phosphate acyltransferase